MKRVLGGGLAALGLRVSGSRGAATLHALPRAPPRKLCTAAPRNRGSPRPPSSGLARAGRAARFSPPRDLPAGNGASPL